MQLHQCFRQALAMVMSCCSLAEALLMAERLPTLSRKLRYLLYPESSTMGIFLAIAIPLDLPNKDVSVSWNFEANYNLPYNATQLTPDLVVSQRNARSMRTLDRRRTYAILERKFEREGLEGRPCLLRTICEAAETPLQHNGLAGELLHIVFTPSSSADEHLPAEFDEAEDTGKSGGDCRLAYPACPQGLLDLISSMDL